MKHLSTAAALLLLSACTAFAAEPLVEQMVKMQERQAAAVKGAAPDCDKMGAALLSTVDEDAALLKRLLAADAGKTSEQKKAEQAELLVKYGQRMKAVQKDFAALKSCKDNGQVKKWKAKLDEATEPRKG